MIESARFAEVSFFIIQLFIILCCSFFNYIYTKKDFIKQYPLFRFKVISSQNTHDDRKQQFTTERGGSVVTHETRIREVPGSNPGADQPD